MKCKLLLALAAGAMSAVFAQQRQPSLSALLARRLTTIQNAVDDEHAGRSSCPHLHGERDHRPRRHHCRRRSQRTKVDAGGLRLGLQNRRTQPSHRRTVLVPEWSSPWKA